LWTLCFEWGRNRESGEALAYELVDNGRIAWAGLIRVPLFTVDGAEVVVRRG
jgi:hypothetical protein